MKFTNTDINSLNNILAICALVDIDALVIEDGQLSSVNSDRTCALLTTTNIPVLPETNKLCISKLKVLRDRLDIFKTDPKLAIEAKEKANGEIASLEISGSNAKVQFKASPRNTVKAPKAINDTAVKEVTITKEEAQTVLTAVKAMGSKKLTFVISEKGEVTIELSDSINDKFDIVLENAAVNLGDKDSFTSYYFADVFSSVLKAAANEGKPVTIIVNEASAIIEVGGYPLTLLCPMDDQ
jgi:hypothetical protein